MQKSVTERLLEWYCTGETGISSMAIANKVAGYPSSRWGDCSPSDAWDLRRCMLLLKQVPEAFERGVLVLATESKEWEVLASSWPQLEKTLVSELGEDLSAKKDTPRTYKLMRSLLDTARAA